jgi:hypothetical protein
MSKIDFVLPWVDSNDKAWQESYNFHKNEQDGDNRISRFRDWDNLRYLFRAFEEFTPWVNKIYFITCGHLPSWLDIKHPKLVIIKHEDYIEKENLPTFNSHVIETNIHNIKGLSEKFVYFNDDTFVLKALDKEIFFKDELPVNLAICTIMHEGEIAHNIVNNIAVINRNFNGSIKRKYKKKYIILSNFFKWFNIKYGHKCLRTILLMHWPSFTGFMNYHHPQPFLKQTFNDVWEKESKLLNKVSQSKFRKSLDVNQYLFKYWQFVTGKFYPDSYENTYKLRKYIEVKNLNDAKKVASAIKSKKYQMYCPNDAVEDENDFEPIKNMINDALKSILPNKSSFEK